MYASAIGSMKLPAERHQLVVAEARQRPADPDEEEQEEHASSPRRQPNVSSVLSERDTAPALSHCVNGMSQPPKNSVAISALAVTMFAYSAMKNSENFIALYSVW